MSAGLMPRCRGPHPAAALPGSGGASGAGGRAANRQPATLAGMHQCRACRMAAMPDVQGRPRIGNARRLSRAKEKAAPEGGLPFDRDVVGPQCIMW